MSEAGLDRREFVRLSGSCAGYLWLALGSAGPGARRLFARQEAGRVVREEPWGRLEELAEGAWALVSTPLAEGPDARRTLSNGGIVAGRDGVLLIEGFASEEGARWMAGMARELTGRRPTHVVLTHYHGDHSHGMPGYRTGEAEPGLYSTRETLEDLEEGAGGRGGAAAAAETLRGPGVELLDGDAARSIDLGGRSVEVVPRAGHTRSDLVVVLEDPGLVWCGDLVWNGLFPNYMDARPSVLSRHVAALLERPARRWIPGHGAVADEAELRAYVSLLEDVEAAARRALESGTPADVAARDYRPPAGLGEWVLFSDRYYEVAFRAWERDLVGDGA